MALVVKDTIEVESSNGLHEIQLCYGSVTKVAAAHSVDVLVCSAFPGNYAATNTSVIGALWKDLKVSVRQLASEKEEDLRSIFSCWWSKELPKAAHFKRLLCFEGGFKAGTRPPMVVSEVFRCLVTMCKDKDITVMMPLLGAGDQGYSKRLMLRLMVNAAIHWMKAGLPLKLLKIVIFSRDPTSESIDLDPLLLYFKELKSKWLEEVTGMELQKNIVIKYDVYLSYSETDTEYATAVIEKLTKTKQDIRIFKEQQKVNLEESFQEEIYTTMVCCARVITLLSPNYLQDPSCVEQYNIALCCTRNVRRDYLAPFYVDTIEQMPTYMCLIQYIDCRPIDGEQIMKACDVVIEWLDQNHLQQGNEVVKQTGFNKEQKNKVLGNTNTYDIFISYAHVDSDKATCVLKMMKERHPDWKFFIDTDMLTIGDSWQIKLYESIESSKVVLALLSVSYLNSIVCQEEFNLACGLDRDPFYKTCLLPVLIEDLPDLPAWCDGCNPLKAFDIENGTRLHEIMSNIKHSLDHKKARPKSSHASLRDLCSSWRSMHHLCNYPFLPCINPNSENRFSKDESSSSADVVVCYNEANYDTGSFLCDALEKLDLDINVDRPDGDAVRFTAIDSATLVVFLISSEFISSPHNMAEFSTALARHRHSDQLIMFPILIDTIPSSPAYMHLIWSLFSSIDQCWRGTSWDRNCEPEKRCLKAAVRAIQHLLISENGMDGKHRTLLPPNELNKSLSSFSLPMINQSNFNPLLHKFYQPTTIIEDGAAAIAYESLSGIEEAVKKGKEKLVKMGKVNKKERKQWKPNSSACDIS